MKFVGGKANDVGFSGSPLPWTALAALKLFGKMGSLGFPLPDVMPGVKGSDLGSLGFPLPDTIQGVKGPDLGSLGFPLPDTKQGVKGPELGTFDFPQY